MHEMNVMSKRNIEMDTLSDSDSQQKNGIESFEEKKKKKLMNKTD